MAVAAVPLTDEHLAALAHQGSRRAFSQLYERHSAPLYRYCLGILRQHHDAQDAVQATMARALLALERAEPPAATRAWLFGIAHNEAVDQLRARRRHGDLDAVELPAPAPSAERSFEQRERLAATLRDLQQLPERQRSALVLRELSGLGDAEIGAALRMTPAGVRQAVFEARSALQELAAGRDLTCDSVRERIAEGDARRLRARPVRAHLRECAGCRGAREAVHGRRRVLAGLVPVPLWAGELLARVGAGAVSPAAEPGALVAKTVLAAAVAATTIGLGISQREHLRLGDAPALSPRPPATTPRLPARAPVPAAVAAAPALRRAPLAPASVERRMPALPAPASPPAPTRAAHRPAPARKAPAPARTQPVAVFAPAAVGPAPAPAPAPQAAAPAPSSSAPTPAPGLGPAATAVPEPKPAPTPKPKPAPAPKTEPAPTAVVAPTEPAPVAQDPAPAKAKKPAKEKPAPAPKEPPPPKAKKQAIAQTPSEGAATLAPTAG